MQVLAYNNNTEKVVLIDEDDHIRIKSYNLFYNNLGYVFFTKDSIRESLHRFIMSAPLGIYVDHINKNTFDNRKENLRLCTNQQNIAGKSPINKYKGLHYRPALGIKQWTVAIQPNGKQIHLGTYTVKKDAAFIYDLHALKIYGDFAYLNFPENIETYKELNRANIIPVLSKVLKMGRKPNES